MLSANSIGGRGALGAGGLTIDLLAQRGLRQLQGFLLRFVSTAHAGFTHDLPVEEHVANLLDHHRIRAGALRSEFGWNRRRSINVEPLARIAGRIDVGEIVAGHFRSRALGLQRAVRHAESAEKSEHKTLY